MFVDYLDESRFFVTWKDTYLQEIMSICESEEISLPEDFESVTLLASKLLLSEERFNSYSYFMSLHYKKLVPRISDLKDFTEFELHKYFLVKLFAYTIPVCVPIRKIMAISKLAGGIFNEIKSRGSQFRVEGCLLPTILNKGFVPLSISSYARENMPATEWIACTLEPQSGYHENPVSVLDFQSLYPSVICAFNIDYGSYLGQAKQFLEMISSEEGSNFNVSEGVEVYISSERKKLLLQKLSKTRIAETVNSSLFILDKKESFVVKMLKQLLATRFEVKRYLKRAKNIEGPDGVLEYDCWQEAIKLVANTTYGYTSANFSGRMPCASIADATVGSGRRTLDNSIILANAKNRVNVAYGDTDSVFLEIKERRKIAFGKSYNIVKEINELVQSPIKLKFEKIYEPCVLESKKRYFGMRYDSEYSNFSKFEAKGVETVRRDCTIAAGKLLRNAFEIIRTQPNHKIYKKFLVQCRKNRFEI